MSGPNRPLQRDRKGTICQQRECQPRTCSSLALLRKKACHHQRKFLRREILIRLRRPEIPKEILGINRHRSNPDVIDQDTVTFLLPMKVADKLIPFKASSELTRKRPEAIVVAFFYVVNERDADELLNRGR
ncbi:hypothetical protein BN2475_1640007 [Paraburkholderia ribeironis]|uniref:Uncharacterized protein n=1 Tax=Paraburkholderia ribeironis TaxID=1247936 RepID=A0A1N7SQD5_9BURK|nr:hypothetical protein BN2475_1640007 [Paraburkholderia ribeironis]